MEAKAVANSDKTVTVYVRKNSGTFNNRSTVALYRDINTSNEDLVTGGSISAGGSQTSFTITPTSGTHKYTFLVISSGTQTIRFCTYPITVTYTAGSPSLSLAGSQGFGTTTLTAGQSYTYSVKVKNSGTADWSGHLFLKNGSQNVLEFYDRTISAGSTVTLTKTYTPTTTGSVSLTLYYQTGGSGAGNEVPEGSYSNPITIKVVGASPSLSLASNPSFGTTTLTAGTSYSFTVKVKNSGTADWSGYLFLKNGSQNVLEFYDRTISAGSTVTLTKTYTPTTTGTFSLTLYYQTGGSGAGNEVPEGSYSNPITITVVGAGPSLSLAGSQSFGTTSLIAGATYTYTVKVKNSGSADWSGHLHLKSGDDDWIHLYDRTIAKGSTVTLTKEHTPNNKTGSHSLTLYYQTGGSGGGEPVPAGSYSNPFTVSVAKPSLSLASTPTFGTTTLTAGTAYNFTVKVKNSGTKEWSGHLFLKYGNTNWVELYDRTISAGSTETLTKSFTPTTTGTFSLTLYYQSAGNGDGLEVPKGSYSNPITVTVAGASASLSLASSQGFGTTTLKLGTSYTYTVNVKNSGTADWTGHLFLKSGEDDWLPFWDRTIKKGTTETLTKPYTPETAGTHTLTLYYQTGGSGDGVPVPKGSYSNPITVTVAGTSNCPFSDCPGGEVCDAANYLHNLGILEGVNGKLLPDDNVTRAQLAKLSLFSLYGGESKVPGTLVSDKFPSIYPDLQNTGTYYYRAAKAMLYLEYQDGISPFDRNRSFFNPENSIERNLVLKVICETFNIKPETSTSSNPFSDFSPSQVAWGYAKKCNELGINLLVNTTKFRPFEYCKRKEAILFLYRLLTSSGVTVPKPNNTYELGSSSFFIPANLSAKTMGVMKGMEAGNFNYYEKNFFSIDGYMPLNFGVTYNSCLTELPSDFYPIAPMGTAWSHTYNTYMTIINDASSSNKTVVFHNADGSLLLYNYDDLSSLTDGGNYLTVARPSASRYTLTSPDKTVYTYERTYAADNIYYLTSITDRNSNTLTITYQDGVTKTAADTYTRRVKTVSTLGRSLTFAYASGTDRVNSVTDPSGRQVTFAYSSGNLKSLKDAKGQTTTFTYGSSDGETGLLTKITLPEGNVINNEYQQRKLRSTQNNSDAPTEVTVTADYTSGTVTTDIERPISGGQSFNATISMDSSGRMNRVTDGDKTNVSMTYGDSGNPTLPTKIVDNKSGITTTLTYNTKGKVTKRVISSGGSSTTEKYTYNSYNEITSYTDANNNVTSYGYSNGNLTSVTDAMSHKTTIVNNNGLPTQVTDPMGRVTKLEYNSYGNLTKVTQLALGLSTSYGYDNNTSRITSITNPNGNTTTYSYDDNDNVVSVTEPLSKVTGYEFDANDNLVKITNANNRATTLSYDDNDLLTGVSFQGSSRYYTYNSDGSLSSSTSANNHTRNYSYDDSGFITDDGYASYSYNSKGWLSSVEKDGNSIDYYYDALGRVTSEEYDGQEVEYGYDSNGNVTSVTYPGNKTVSYTYNALNQVTAVTDWNSAQTTFSYNNDGSVNYVQLPNKVRTTYTYDNAGRLKGITTKRNSGSGTAIAAYTFDEMDDLGNHLTETVTEPYTGISLTSGTTSYTYNTANRITKAGSISFAYDGNGNTTSRTGRTMKYDIINNLTQVTGDFSASYTYDGRGQRRSATRDGTTTKYVLSGNYVVAETNASGTVQYYYIYGPTGLIARITPSGTTRYYVSDFRGSVVAMTDATTSANVTHKYQYDDFGQVLQSQEEDTNRFRYVGVHGVMHETDGLTFMRARYYDPTIGRFLSEDPIWNTNLYPYAENNPIMGIDPEGKLLAWVTPSGKGVAYIPDQENDKVFQGEFSAIDLLSASVYLENAQQYQFDGENFYKKNKDGKWEKVKKKKISKEVQNILIANWCGAANEVDARFVYGSKYDQEVGGDNDSLKQVFAGSFNQNPLYNNSYCKKIKKINIELNDKK